jgi:hypothetical protein
MEIRYKLEFQPDLNRIQVLYTKFMKYYGDVDVVVFRAYDEIIYTYITRKKISIKGDICEEITVKFTHKLNMECNTAYDMCGFFRQIQHDFFQSQNCDILVRTKKENIIMTCSTPQLILNIVL